MDPEQIEEHQEHENVVEVPETEHPEPPQKEWSDDDEAEAKAFGWKSPDEWEGDVPPGYIDDPRRFMERAENFTPFRKMRERLEAKEREADERFRKLEAMNEKALERQRAQFESQMQDISRQQRAAVESGDTEAYDRLEAQKGMLQPPEAPEAKAQPNQPDPQQQAMVEQYRMHNSWAQDPVIWEAAVRGTTTVPESASMSMPELLQLAEQKAREYYPHKFEQPKPKPRAPAVDSGGLAGAKKSGFGKLPGDAKQAFQRFYAQGVYGDMKKEEAQEEYAREYNAA